MSGSDLFHRPTSNRGAFLRSTAAPPPPLLLFCERFFGCGCVLYGQTDRPSTSRRPPGSQQKLLNCPHLQIVMLFPTDPVIACTALCVRHYERRRCAPPILHHLDASLGATYDCRKLKNEDACKLARWFFVYFLKFLSLSAFWDASSRGHFFREGYF